MATPLRNFDMNRADVNTTGRDEGPVSVLLVAADEQVLRSCARRLAEAGLHVTVARTGFEAIVKATCQLPDVIVMQDGLVAGEGVDSHAARELIGFCPATCHIPVVPYQGLEAVERDAARGADLLSRVQTELARR
jgi:hypothetical protein